MTNRICLAFPVKCADASKWPISGKVLAPAGIKVARIRAVSRARERAPTSRERAELIPSSGVWAWALEYTTDCSDHGSRRENESHLS